MIITDTRNFPQIGFNRYKQHQLQLLKRSSLLRSSLKTQSLNSYQIPSHFSTQRSGYQNSYSTSFRVSTRPSVTRYARESFDPQNRRSQEKSFIDCDKQLQIVSSAEKNDFPLMSQLLQRNQDLVNDQLAQTSTFHNYDIINPEVKKIIEEFKHVQSEVVQPLSICDKPPMESTPTPKSVERHGLYQYMRDCQKLQKCRSDQRIKLFEMSEKLKSCNDSSPLQPAQEAHYLHQSPESLAKPNDSIKVYESVTDAPTRNSVNSSAKQYVTKSTTWGKENKNKQPTEPQKPLKNFYKRLEHDVNRRQKKPANAKKPVGQSKQTKPTVMDRHSVLKAIERLGSQERPKDQRLLKDVKSTIDWLYSQVETKKDDDFLQEFERLDQFTLFL